MEYILDLVLTNRPELFLSIDFYCSIGTSDHNSVIWNFLSVPNRILKREIPDYSKWNYNLIAEKFDKLGLKDRNLGAFAAKSKWNIFYNTIYH